MAPFWHPKSVPENLINPPKKTDGCCRSDFEIEFVLPGALVDISVAVGPLPIVWTATKVPGVRVDALGPVAARVGGAGVL